MDRESPLFALAVPVAAAVMILLWFVPDLLRTPIVFSFQSIAQMEGTTLAALITPPVAGALLLLLFAVRHPARLVHIGSAIVGAAAAASLLLFGKPTFVFGPIFCVPTAAGLVIAAVVTRRRGAGDVQFVLLLAALPTALMAYAVYGILTDAYPAVYLLPLKLPITLFAALFSAATSMLQTQTE